jgi:hypothetical protein
MLGLLPYASKWLWIVSPSLRGVVVLVVGHGAMVLHVFVVGHGRSLVVIVFVSVSVRGKTILNIFLGDNF